MAYPVRACFPDDERLPVEYYVQSLRQVHLCQSNGMSEEDIAAATGRSLSLVREYLELIRDFNLTNIPNSEEEN